MPELRRCGKAWHARPLLNFTREQLFTYAKQESLTWIEDDSNQSTRFDRNYLRLKVIPLLKERWTMLTETISRAASHQAESVLLNEELARIDNEQCKGVVANTLNLTALGKLSTARQKNTLRFWLQELQFPLPDTKKLRHILTDVLASKTDAIPCVSWSGVEIRRYRDEVYVLAPLPVHDNCLVRDWHIDHVCKLTHGELFIQRGKGDGIRMSTCPDKIIQVRYRLGGETIKPVGRQHHHQLKKLFQERGIPPWLRSRIPLLYINGQLAAIPGICIDEEFYAEAEEESWRITWTGHDELFIKQRS